MYMYMFARGLNFHSFYNFSIILWNYSDILLSFDFYFIIALYSFCANVPGCVNYKKGCTRLAAASDKVYHLPAHGLWFSSGTPTSSTTKTGRHDIVEILLKVVLNTKNQIKSPYISIFTGICIQVYIYILLVCLVNITPYLPHQSP